MNKLDINILVAGLTRDSEKTLASEIKQISLALQGYKEVYWLIVESDSTDNTINVLDDLKDSIDNFEYAALGILSKDYPVRSPRVSACRNYYINEINSNEKYTNIDYVIMADLDGLNTEITQQGIESCWERDDWDVCTANQNGPYYDIWALRHNFLCPNDAWKEYDFFKNTLMLSENEALEKAIVKRMFNINTNLDWIEVDSAFGGFAIFKKNILKNCLYVGTYPDGSPICEHVPFNKQIRNNGGRIFINPQLINAKSTEHVNILKPHRRLLRFIKSYFT